MCLAILSIIKSVAFYVMQKLDMVARLITDPSKTSFTNCHPPHPQKNTCAMWYVTREILDMTYEKLPSFSDFQVNVCWRKFHKGSLSEWVSEWVNELDKVAQLITKPPPTSFTTLSQKEEEEKKKKKTSDTWHMTCDMWHMTHDTWQMTHDTWHMTRDMWHILLARSERVQKIYPQRITDWVN